MPNIQRSFGHVPIVQPLHYIGVGQKETAKAFAVVETRMRAGSEAQKILWLAFAILSSTLASGGTVGPVIAAIGPVSVATIVLINSLGNHNGIYVYGYTTFTHFLWWSWTNCYALYMVLPALSGVG